MITTFNFKAKILFFIAFLWLRVSNFVGNINDPNQVVFCRYSHATDSYHKALALLDQAELTAQKKQSYREALEKVEAACRGKPDQTVKVKKTKPAEDETNFNSDPDSLYPNLSASCEVRSSPEKGLYVVAKETLTPGDVIIKEKAYAWSVEPEFKHTYCHHCMSR